MRNGLTGMYQELGSFSFPRSCGFVAGGTIKMTHLSLVCN